MEKKLKRILNSFTIIFLFFIPLFSTVYFHNHLVTLLEIICIFVMFIATIILYKESRSKLKYLLLYMFIVFTYIIISYIRSKYFVSLVPGNFHYSIISECLTILKLITPVIFLYSLYYQKIDKKKYFFIINIWVILISASIIISNLLELSYSSYSYKLIDKNIFEWSSTTYYIKSASRGLFMYANQISAIMIMLLLLSVYEYLYIKKRYLINIILLVVTMLMLGTRISTIGGLLTLTCAFIFYLLLSLFNKENIKKETFLLIIPILTFILLIPISPFANRNKELNNVPEPIEKQTIIIDGNTKKVKKVYNYKVEDTKVDFVYNNYNPNYLPKIFFEKYYPIKYDIDFWYEFIKTTPIENMNYRLIEKSIINRVIDVNNKKSDKLFGISNTRIQNIVNLEQDFVLHYYAFGIIGSIILLITYLVLPVIAVYNFFKRKDYFTFIISTSILLFIFSSILTGNIINSLNATIPFIFISSGLIYKKE